MSGIEDIEIGNPLPDEVNHEFIQDELGYDHPDAFCPKTAACPHPRYPLSIHQEGHYDSDQKRRVIHEGRIFVSDGEYSWTDGDPDRCIADLKAQIQVIELTIAKIRELFPETQEG